MFLIIDIFLVFACVHLSVPCGPGATVDRGRFDKPFVLFQRMPDIPEESVGASGSFRSVTTRDSPKFQKLVKNYNPGIVFEDEEKSGADRIMTRVRIFRQGFSPLIFWLISMFWSD